MDPQNPTPGETPPASPTGNPPAGEPAAPAGNPAPAPNEPTPSGSEPDTNPGGSGEPATVPSSRLREETEKRRAAEEEAAQLRQQLEERDNTPPPAPAGDEDELDPDVEKLLDGYAKKRGLVSKDELAAERLQEQVRQDVKSLEADYANSGVPYVHQDVLKYAKDNNLPITSKAALRAAYRDMNFEKIAEQERQRAIAGINGNAGGAEKPGSSGSRPPAEPEPSGKNPKERNMSRIRQARQKISA